MKQCELSRITGKNSKRKMVTWLPEENWLKEGNIICSKGRPEKWTIDKIYSYSMNKENINHGWHVGGL